LVSNGVVGADLWTSSERGIFLWDIVCTNATRGWHYYNGTVYAMGLGMSYNGTKKWIGLHPWEPLSFEVLKPIRGPELRGPGEVVAMGEDDAVEVEVAVRAHSEERYLDLVVSFRAKKALEQLAFYFMADFDFFNSDGYSDDYAGYTQGVIYASDGPQPFSNVFVTIYSPDKLPLFYNVRVWYYGWTRDAFAQPNMATRVGPADVTVLLGWKVADRLQPGETANITVRVACNKFNIGVSGKELLKKLDKLYDKLIDLHEAHKQNFEEVYANIRIAEGKLYEAGLAGAVEAIDSIVSAIGSLGSIPRLVRYFSNAERVEDFSKLIQDVVGVGAPLLLGYGETDLLGLTFKVIVQHGATEIVRKSNIVNNIASHFGKTVSSYVNEAYSKMSTKIETKFKQIFKNEQDYQKALEKFKEKLLEQIGDIVQITWENAISASIEDFVSQWNSLHQLGFNYVYGKVLSDRYEYHLYASGFNDTQVSPVAINYARQLQTQISLMMRKSRFRAGGVGGVLTIYGFVEYCRPANIVKLSDQLRQNAENIQGFIPQTVKVYMDVVDVGLGFFCNWKSV